MDFLLELLESLFEIIFELIYEMTFELIFDLIQGIFEDSDKKKRQSYWKKISLKTRSNSDNI